MTGNKDLNQDKSPADSEVKDNIDKKSHNGFVKPSIILFIDSLLISAGNWFYWLVISKLTLASEIGIAVTVYSLVMLVTTLTQLGLEYPLLKKSILPGSRILGTSLAIELVITLASIPFVIVVINTLYNESIEHFTWLAIGLLVILSIEFVVRFGLLGVSNSKTVLIIDLIALAIKLPIGFFLVYMSQGALGILIAYLLEGLFITLTSLFVLRNRFGFRLGNIEYFKETVKDALVNTPSKWSKMVIVTLSIILLAYLNINTSDIGIFYISLMITVVAGSFASSMAYMVIPSSATLFKDLSTSGLRISLSLTAPIVVALLVAPKSILSLIGPDYESAETSLFILAMAIIPSSITINMISKLNNLNSNKFLILSGLLQIVIFLVCFFALVPIYGSVGAAISILVAYLSSALLLVVVTEHKSFRYIIYASLSVLAGFIVGYMAGMIMGHEQQFLIMILSVAMSILVIFASKNMTIKETNFLLKSLFQRS
jgi:O-antigen/teichoic acid export membrane protein